LKLELQLEEWRLGELGENFDFNASDLVPALEEQETFTE
jgi:hypothetical protein